MTAAETTSISPMCTQDALSFVVVVVCLFALFCFNKRELGISGGRVCLQAKVLSLVDIDHFRCKMVVHFSSIVQHVSLKIFL